MTRTYVQRLGVLIVAGTMGLNGCSSRETSTTGPSSESVQDAGLVAPTTPKERALRAKEDMFRRLSSELVSAMSHGGPSAAIEVCSQKAPEIAAAVGEEHRVAIGRTSFKLRSPANAPPEWARPLVEDQEQAAQFIDLPDGSTGALLPILLKPQCLVCHGKVGQLGEGVAARLEELYPEDQATGFEDGDLRGWFWVEVPAE